MLHETNSNQENIGFSEFHRSERPGENQFSFHGDDLVRKKDEICNTNSGFQNGFQGSHCWASNPPSSENCSPMFYIQTPAGQSSKYEPRYCY